jgi:tetratricopeptide (TPR) repeat protein
MESVDTLLELAMEASDQGDNDKAIGLYEQILAREEAWSTPHYNLGLIYKYRREWEKSFYHNTRAVELDPENQGAQWNLGIAATMLKQWKVARTCWNVFGTNYEIVDEDTAGYVGVASIRINPHDEAETVWATRICPTRAQINNIPFPESGHGFQDVVLNDGAPKGQRMLDGRKYSVYDEIEHLERSAYQTFSIKCKADPQRDPDFLNLRDRCHHVQIAMEDWTTVEWLCQQCSEGIPHEKHDEKIKHVSEERHLAFAALSQEALDSILHGWADETGIVYYDPISYSVAKSKE